MYVWTLLIYMYQMETNTVGYHSYYVQWMCENWRKKIWQMQTNPDLQFICRLLHQEPPHSRYTTGADLWITHWCLGVGAVGKGVSWRKLRKTLLKSIETQTKAWKPKLCYYLHYIVDFRLVLLSALWTNLAVSCLHVYQMVTRKLMVRSLTPRMFAYRKCRKKTEQPIFSLSSHLENLDRITSTHPHIVTCIQSGFNVKGEKSLVLV